MKRALLFVSIALLTLAGCATVSKGADLVGGLTRTGGAAGAVMAGEADFRSDEVLCSFTEDDKIPWTRDFRAAKVLDPRERGDQEPGRGYLSGRQEGLDRKFVVPSHKATNAEIKVGAPILFNAWAGTEKLSADDYRQGAWYFGNVTSVDELFKGIVEVKGDKKYIKNCRFPNQPIQ